jgi:hypothetical protein
MNKLLLLILSITTIFIFACKKNSFITSRDAQINFSADTIYFDTVFTATGSITQQVKIINQNNQKINLTDVKLMGGAFSVFKINIDGAAVTEANNIEIDANDSIYVFVSVYINPSTANLAFILQDSIQVSFNGNQQYIQLQAYGQNANFLNNKEISTNTIWSNNLPYVILGGLQVDSNTTLTIQQGCKIYLHANAPFIVNGSLQVQGQQYDSTRIYFSGDRLDVPYNGYPGSWPGIIFNPGCKNNLLEFAVINNAYQGIITTGLSVNTNPKITLNECIINNVYDAGILATQSDIQARNCLVSNCGRNIVISDGGNYSFTNCTVASYSNNYISHTQPVLNITDYLAGNNSPSALTASFVNCIFWGDNGTVTDEVVVSEQGTPAISFANCLWKVTDIPSSTNTNMLNSDPMFDSINNQTLFYDFHLKSGSPALGTGVNTSIPFDLDGNPRTVAGKTDLGCYEKQ